MRKKFTALLFSFYIMPCPAQRDASLNTNSTVLFDASNNGNSVHLADMNGHPLNGNVQQDVAGSPYINEDWAWANLTLSQGKILTMVAVKLNIENNELHYTDSTGKELVAMEGIVRRVEYINFITKEKTGYLFKNGYPAINKQNQDFYYQVLAEGKAELLVKKTKYIRTSKDDMTGIVTREFVDAAQVYYVFANSAIKQLNASKKEILDIMKDKEQLVDSFIETNKINFKKNTDLIKLFNYYNGLN